MTEEFTTELDELYLKVRNLPASDPEEFKTFSIKRKQYGKRGYFSSLITNVKKYFRGFFGRVKMWNEKILPACYEFPELKLAKENNLETKVTNTFFRSRMEIFDKKNKRKLTIYSPLFSSILSYFFGNMVKIKLGEYTPSHKESYEKQHNEQPSYA